VLDAFCAQLELTRADVPWFAARDRIRDVAHALGELGASAERIAAEMIRLQATEVAEFAEGVAESHVGSSTMPQKLNPMMSEYLVASARLLRATDESQGALRISFWAGLVAARVLASVAAVGSGSARCEPF